MEMDFKAGRARIAIVGGWLVDLETGTQHYVTQHSNPIYETTTHTTHYEERYLDSDGDVRSRHWSHSEDRTEQVGSDDYEVAHVGTTATYRIIYDDGTKSPPESHPAHSGYGDRVHWYSIAHPLLRSPVKGRVYAMATQPRRLTRWQLLVTLSARRAIGREVKRDRQTLLEAASKAPPRAEDRSLHHLLVDGRWDASRRKVRTARGDHALPHAGRLADGAAVGLLLRDRGFALPFGSKDATLVVDGWAAVGGTSWASRRKPLVERLWKTRVPVAVMLMAIILAGAAIPLRSNPLLVLAGLAAVVAVLGFRGVAESRETWLDRFHANNVMHSLRMLRQGHWVEAMKAAGRS